MSQIPSEQHDAPTVAQIIGQGGHIARRLEAYEPRDEQQAMAEAVHSSILNGRHLMVEAGTGVGKSFAYLVPAILAACEKGKRVVVSTHTISLQEQLINKDIPFLRAVLPFEFTATLVKGRSNYVSLRRLATAQHRSDAMLFQAEEFDQLKSIQNWASETADGSRSDLGFRPLPQVWDEVQSETNNCLGKKCETFNQCHFFKARRRVHNSQILIVNHSLFFSDLALRQVGAGFLPDYEVAIFDEAHTIESVAADHLGGAVTSGQIDYLLNKLHNPKTNRGLLHHHRFPDSQGCVSRVRREADAFFDSLEYWLASRTGNGRVREPISLDGSVTSELRKLGVAIANFAEGISDDGDRQELIASAERCDALASSIAHWLKQDSEDFVYWGEMNQGRRRRMEISCAPIQIGPAMRSQLFEKIPTCIMTSATLCVGNKRPFDFFKDRIGLTHCEMLKLGSPFDFQRQMKIYLHQDSPDPSADSKRFEQSLVERIREYIKLTDGGAFVLFTSYRAMRDVTSNLQAWLVENDYPFFSQAEGMPRSQMLDEFRKTTRSVLFGTDSFWQGVDVRGEELRNVIITKLPFSVPDHPLLEAKLDALRDAGRNPFMDFQLPESVIKLKQGVGRLIRSHADHGIVVILDPRVITKRYGSVFMNSLPQCEIVVDGGSDE